jgi:hypothetical protein
MVPCCVMATTTTAVAGSQVRAACSPGASPLPDRWDRVNVCTQTLMRIERDRLRTRGLRWMGAKLGGTVVCCGRSGRDKPRIPHDDATIERLLAEWWPSEDCDRPEARQCAATAHAVGSVTI